MKRFTDTTIISQVQGKCKVLSKEDFDRLPATDQSRDDIFVCRFHYDPNKYDSFVVSALRTTSNRLSMDFTHHDRAALNAGRALCQSSNELPVPPPRSVSHIPSSRAYVR